MRPRLDCDVLYGAVFCVAGVLALKEDTAVAAGLQQGPDLGVHHPAALPMKRDRRQAVARWSTISSGATDPAPPPSPSSGS
ncbi:MAG: hypothetical protein KF810_10625 [Rhizobiaceae bacterium]|nr:hypothetical protein [Rhizobiaceae bacterium]